MSDLRGVHVLVVGATGGLGSAISRELASAGAVLTLCGRRADAVAALHAELGPAVVGVVAADLADPAAPGRIVQSAVRGGGTLGGVVYAAGVVAFGPVLELDDKVLDELLVTNFVAPVRLLRAAAAVLETGSFVLNLSAIVAELPTAGMAAYSATKAALTAFDRAAATELRKRGIRVLDVRPPHTETGLADRPISGTPPRLPTGLDPRAVAARAFRAIVADERDLPAREFSGG